MKMDVKQRQMKVAQEKSILFEKLVNEEFETSLLLERDKEVRRMLHFNKLSSTEPFIFSFEKAMKCYIRGSWKKANKYFEKCLVMKPNDGPSLALNKYITDRDFDSVKVNWKGHRLIGG